MSTKTSMHMDMNTSMGINIKKNNKIIFIWLFIIIIIFAANHIEYHFRMQSIADKNKKTGAVIVKEERGRTGHSTIGVDEDSMAGNSDETFLRFSSLGTWNFDPDKAVPCPDNIKKLNNRPVSCIGFMYPLEPGTEIKLFALLRTTQTCCYGPRPQYNQYIFVEMKEPVQFERMRPIVVQGLFFVDPKPEEGYIYRMEAHSTKVVKDNVPDINGAEAAKKANLKLFNFCPLECMKNPTNKNSDINVPPELSSLNNTTVVVEGFLVGSTEDVLPKQIVGKYWWDGVMQGTPPDFYNAVMVFPKDISQVPPAWKQKVVFTGELNITQDKALYAENGIISIRNAVRGVPDKSLSKHIFNAGPFLTLWHEAVLLGIFILWAFRRLRLNQG